jgi:SAM-dependent methyltransferase
VLKARAIAEELMDAGDLAPETYAAVVHDLARVNMLTLARRPTLGFLRRAIGSQTSFRLLDVGFGDGDMLRAIARWAGQRGLQAELMGVDLNPRSAPAAQSVTPDDLPIRYVTGDYASLADESFDFIVSSLVAHHMTPAQLRAFLIHMDKHAKLGWLVNDLHRHGFAWVGFPLLATLMRWHPIVRHDGQLSIARSYRPQEWPALLAAAGIKQARVFRAFPFRLCVERIR